MENDVLQHVAHQGGKNQMLDPQILGVRKVFQHRGARNYECLQEHLLTHIKLNFRFGWTEKSPAAPFRIKLEILNATQYHAY